MTQMTVITLPETCGARHPDTGEAVLLKRGETGYWPLSCDPDVYNESLGITPAQREAMLAGSMFGFDVPAADPKIYEGTKLSHKA